MGDAFSFEEDSMIEMQQLSGDWYELMNQRGFSGSCQYSGLMSSVRQTHGGDKELYFGIMQKYAEICTATALCADSFTVAQQRDLTMNDSD